MRRVLFDTNIILDIALKRQPHFKHAAKLFTLIDQNTIAGCVTASTVTDIYYISRKEKGHEEALDFISNLLQVLEVLGIDKNTILGALKLPLKDFEDDVQVAAAQLGEVTR